MRTEIVARFQVPGVHRWKDCSIDEVSYLKHEHRHLFHFEARMHVGHPDREEEFICLGADLKNQVLKHWYRPHLNLCDFGLMSCETIGQWLLSSFPKLTQVSVFEDGENGAVIYR